MLGNHPAGPGKLVCLSPRSGNGPGGWRIFPGAALGGRELPEPALLASLLAACAGQRCGLLAINLSRAGQVQAFPGNRRSSFNPAGTHGGFEGSQARLEGMPSNAAHFYTGQWLGALVSPSSAETNSRIQSHPSLDGRLSGWLGNAPGAAGHTRPFLWA